MKMSIAMVFEALLSFQPVKRLTSYPLTLVKEFDRCRGSVNLLEGGKALGDTLRPIGGGGLEGFPTLELSLNFDRWVANLIKG